MIARADIWEIARRPGVLTPQQLRVLELKELHGFTWNQIAFALGRVDGSAHDLDRSTVRGHYRAAQRRLIAYLEQES